MSEIHEFTVPQPLYRYPYAKQSSTPGWTKELNLMRHSKSSKCCYLRHQPKYMSHRQEGRLQVRYATKWWPPEWPSPHRKTSNCLKTQLSSAHCKWVALAKCMHTVPQKLVQTHEQSRLSNVFRHLYLLSVVDEVTMRFANVKSAAANLILNALCRFDGFPSWFGLRLCHYQQKGRGMHIPYWEWPPWARKDFTPAS